MTRLFRSNSTPIPTAAPLCADEEDTIRDDGGSDHGGPAASPPFSSGGSSDSPEGDAQGRGQQPYPVLALLVAALRKSVVTCSAVHGTDGDPSMEIGRPTDVRHVSHVTFDCFRGFLGLPTEFRPQLPPRVPSASVTVFGVSAASMQCSYDQRGNSVPTILLMLQRRLYAGGGLEVEGIFRIAADNSQEEYVRSHLNRGVLPGGVDVHCLSGLIKAWFRELPRGLLDSVPAERLMRCRSEGDWAGVAALLPATEAALLDWAVNLMADVAEQEQRNKMNPRNIALVFAPNMTRMGDPLTALIHAVQVMNFLKTMILRTLGERQQPGSAEARAQLSPSAAGSPGCSSGFPMDCGEVCSVWGEGESVAGGGFEGDVGDESVAEGGDGGGLRRLLCRHPGVFQSGKSGKKGMRRVEFGSCRRGDGEARA